MKATGIVLRVDDLKRIVIPKENHQEKRMNGGKVKWKQEQLKNMF